MSARASGQYRVYGYRWVVLAVFMLVNVTIQMLWISYAPITSLNLARSPSGAPLKAAAGPLAP